AELAQAHGQFERSARLLGATEVLLVSIAGCLETLDRVVYDRNVALLRAQLDEGILSALLAEGRAMSLGQSIAYGLGADESRPESGEWRSLLRDRAAVIPAKTG